MLLDRIPSLCSLSFCMWSKYFRGTRALASCTTVSGRRPAQQSVCTADIIFQDGVKKERKKEKKKPSQRSAASAVISDFRGRQKWQVAAWSVRARHLHEKQESIPLIRSSCCHINDAMHYSRTVCTFGGKLSCYHIFSQHLTSVNILNSSQKSPKSTMHAWYEHTPTNTHAQKTLWDIIIMMTTIIIIIIIFIIIIIVIILSSLISNRCLFLVFFVNKKIVLVHLTEYRWISI